MNNDKIKCMFFDYRFKKKPQGKECGWVQKSIKETEISIENLAVALANGASFKPSVLVNGNKAENWCQQQLFGLDFDDGTEIEEAYNKVIELGIVPCFMYTTFSHKQEHHKFRMIFCNDTVINDGDLRDKLQATLMGVVGGIDEVCFNRDRLFFGGNGKVAIHTDYQARINAEDIIGWYWDNDFERYIPSAKGEKKTTSKRKNNVTRESVVLDDNADIISKLDIEAMQKCLGITEKNKTSQFPNEAELYQFINSIDLHEYLGVPDGMFSCILPNHDDNAPSANIYTTDDGTQIYKCFGCNQSRTIISITEQLAHCKRSEAINFIKKVYKIDYKPSEWVEKQRQLMIDSALYLNSEEFKETFPQINKLIRTRKADIQNILIHMTKHISDGLQYDGKPLFFASLTSLMKICDRKNKNIMSQSITLFALLNMLNKVDLNCIPPDELNKAKQISAKYGLKKLVNFYQVEEYGYITLENSEKIAGKLLNNNITLKGLSREYILRTFGTDLADKIYPQYKSENKRGTSAKSDALTVNLSIAVMNAIKSQGYIFERDINTNGTIGTQWKKSIQEILDSYGLKRVKLNKELKKKYKIECGGYPYIIIADEQSN